MRICSRLGTARANLRTERKVAKHSDDFVNANSRTDRRAYDDVHTALSVVNQFIVDREELHSAV